MRWGTKNFGQEGEVNKLLETEQGGKRSEQEGEPMHEAWEEGKKVGGKATPDSGVESMSNKLEMPQESEHGVLQDEAGQRRVNHEKDKILLFADDVMATSVRNSKAELVLSIQENYAKLQ